MAGAEQRWGAVGPQPLQPRAGEVAREAPDEGHRELLRHLIPSNAALEARVEKEMKRLIVDGLDRSNPKVTS